MQTRLQARILMFRLTLNGVYTPQARARLAGCGTGIQGGQWHSQHDRCRREEAV